MAKIKCWGKVQLKNFETNEGSSNIYSEYEQTYETSIEKKNYKYKRLLLR